MLHEKHWGLSKTIIITKPNFDSFVAYDFETTGLSSSADTITTAKAYLKLKELS